MEKKNKKSKKHFISLAAALMISAVLLFKLFLNFEAMPVKAAAGTSTENASSAPVENKKEDKVVIINVPFSSQAPLGEWGDQRQEDGCEEAASLMAMAWVNDKKGGSAEEWRNEITGLSDWEQKTYGEYRDISLYDVLTHLFGNYFDHRNAAIKSVRGAADIIDELEKGNIVLIPANGRALNNPYYTAPGPERHVLLIKGYDYASKEFITNDPGTRHGNNYRYPEAILFNAIRDYKTGYEEPFGPLKKDMLVVGKAS